MLAPSSVMGMRDAEPDIKAGLGAEEYAAALAEGRAWPRDEATLIGIELGKRRADTR